MIPVSGEVTFYAFENDLAIMTKTKREYELGRMANRTLEMVNNWMTTYRKVVLFSIRKIVAPINL